MPNNTFNVAGVAVVLVAEHLDPAIINPDFLINKKIMPKGLKHTTSVATPAFAHITYQNRLSVVVEKNLCIFEEKRGNTSGSKYRVYECARKYAENLDNNYLSLGMNWHVTLARDDPNAWLKNRFLKPGAWQNNLRLANIAFSIPGPDSATCNFTLHTPPSGQQPPQENMMQPPILLGCNLDFQLQNTKEQTKRISNILQGFKKHETFIKKKLTKYFGES